MPVNIVEKQDKQRVEDHIKEALRPDTTLMDMRLIEATAREDYWENVYIIRWFSESRAEETGQYGTHRALVNEEQVAIIWGHYDMDHSTSLKDYTERI